MEIFRQSGIFENQSDNDACFWFFLTAIGEIQVLVDYIPTAKMLLVFSHIIYLMLYVGN